jgi:iron complex outermembrane receptor protein
MVDGRVEVVGVDAAGGMGTATGDATRARVAYGAGLQLEQLTANGRLLIVPAVHVSVVDSRFAVEADTGEFDDAGRDDVTVGVSPRLGANVRLGETFTLRASGGRYYRPPTLWELFGGSGFVVGNEGLVPESGTSVDLGGSADAQLGPVATYVQVAAFALWTDDLIQWVQNATVVRPINVEGARTAGLEVGVAADAWSRTLLAHASYTWLDSENRSPEAEQTGRALPGRPRHELFVHASVGRPLRVGRASLEPRLGYTFDYVAGTFLDPSGRVEVPARIVHGASAQLRIGDRVLLAVEARNLIDTRQTTWTPPVGDTGTLQVPIADFLGYPLPGRSVWLSATVSDAW